MSDHPDQHSDLSSPAGAPPVVTAVFDQLPMMVVATEGPDHRIVAATDAYRTYTDRPRLIGARMRDVFAEVLGQQPFQAFDKVYDSGRPLFLPDFRAEMVLPHAGGLVEFFVDLNYAPRFGSRGEVVGVTAVMVDVTERVRQRQAAQRRTDEAERRFEHAREMINALQRQLLPAGVPVLPGLQIAASYLLADSDTAAGGDWFDALVLPGGRCALIVGDVVGHGVAASAAMGQLRVLLAERLTAGPETDADLPGKRLTANPETDAELPDKRLTAGPDIGAVLRAVDRAATRIPGAASATVCVVVLDPVTGDLRYCTAGHPPPLLVPVGEPARYLPPSGAGPLGVGGTFTAEHVGADRLDDGDLLLLYTDGILERPDRDLAASTVELAQAAGDIVGDRAMRLDTASPAERVCTQTLEILTRISGYRDDITLLAGQRVAPPADLSVDFSVDQQWPAEIRKRLQTWLNGFRVNRHDSYALVHAVVELVTNSMDHAYLDSAGPHLCRVTACLLGSGEVRLQVSDRGRWRAPAPSPDRGLGLQITAELVDTLHIDHDDQGTTTTVSLRLNRPARLFTAGDVTWKPAPVATGQNLPLLVLDQPSAPGPRIRVEGPVDATTVAEFHRGIRTAGSTGARPLTVDLTGVTHLASAGVAALHQLDALHRGNTTELILFAPAGSTADMVLTLVALAHRTEDPDYPIQR
ncbi:SpoIIE family protein phosphatase [Actinoplanes sp. LDG1-06]|uniref:SpoIIE family protein phosphatase n=1 Tax=Paractinoplanes ovalisporus TaxID=2810368 RepID=A0ABS2AFM3_9ACTN|nr:SpoIIE family protein phosphatase [Actinoplanes ovalisporus]MBM2618628.1 SpoIIE family protein phosphatase [Actinoplanes ovalisporus]